MFKKIKKHHLILFLILATASFLRLYRIDVLMRFIWDEGRDMLAVRNIIVNHDLTLFGPFNEIAGHKDFFGVFQYYLILPSLWMANFDPTGPAIFTALLGVVGIFLAYYWLSQWQKIEIVLTTAALLAISPLVVRFNQWAWNPNTIGFFAMLYLIALQFYQKQKKNFWLGIAGLFFGLLFQLHYFTVALVGAFLTIFFKDKKKNYLGLILFTTGFLLPNLTFLLFDLTHEGFYRKIIFESFFGHSNQKFFVFSVWNLIAGPIIYLSDLFNKFFASKVLAVFFLFAFVVFLWQAFKKNNEEKQLAFSWILFLLLTAFFPSLLDDYHSGALWIGIALSSVLALQKVFKKKFIFIFVLLSIWLIFANKFWRQPTWQENMPRLRNTSFAITEDIQKQNSDKINLASFVDPETRGIRFRYFIDIKNQKLLGFDDYPRSDILYVISPHSWEETQNNPAWELDTFREAAADAIWTDGEWNVYRVSK